MFKDINGDYYVVEYKYKGQAKLKQTTTGKQLSKQWIESSINSEVSKTTRLEEAVGASEFDKINAKGYKSVLAEVGPDGSAKYSLRDVEGNKLSDFYPASIVK